MIQPNEIFAQRYRLIRLIGRGGFAEVWLAEDIKANIEVALKVYAPQGGMDDEGLKAFMQEFSLVFNLNHSHLLRPSYFDEWERKPYLILPYCANGSCKRLIGNISEDDLWRLLRDVANGLSYLHRQERPIIHQDIKPDNILIDSQGDFLISDFGISSKIRSSLRKSVINNSCGTSCYMGPERFSKSPAPIKASDIWSVGAMAFELMMGDVPFEQGGLFQKSGAEIPDITSNYSNELKQVVERCLALDPWNRPTAEQLAEHASNWIKGTCKPFVEEVDESHPTMVGRITKCKEDLTIEQNECVKEESNEEDDWVWTTIIFIFILGVFGSVLVNYLVNAD